MTIAAGATRSTADGERRELLAELFHALNQPLTTLRCALELSLQRPQSEEGYRHAIEAALQQAESITRVSGGIRDLLEADDPGDRVEVVGLAALVGEAILDWRPLAEAGQIRLLYENTSPCPVRFEAQRLRQALVRLFEWVWGSSSAGSTMRIEVAERNGAALLRIATSPTPASAVESRMECLKRRLGLAIARRFFETAGGSLELTGGEPVLEARLPLATDSVGADRGQHCAIER